MSTASSSPRIPPPRAPSRCPFESKKARGILPPTSLPTPPTTLPDSPLVIHAQAAKQFRTDADALLAPFRNRVPTGVVGLERIVGEYVAIRARDDARRLAMDANPLARRMYEQLDDYAMHGGAGGVGGGGAAMRPGPGMTPSATAGGGRHSMAVRHPRASTAVRPILPAPTPEERERMAAAAASAAAARADAAGPGPGSTAAARGTQQPPPPPPSVKSPHKRKGPAPHRRTPYGQTVSPGGGTLPAPAPPPPMGSLMDDAPGERGWRQYELPAELADQRIQERLAEYIVGFTGKFILMPVRAIRLTDVLFCVQDSRVPAGVSRRARRRAGATTRSTARAGRLTAHRRTRAPTLRSAACISPTPTSRS